MASFNIRFTQTPPKLITRNTLTSAFYYAPNYKPAIQSICDPNLTLVLTRCKDLMLLEFDEAFDDLAVADRHGVWFPYLSSTEELNFWSVEIEFRNSIDDYQWEFKAFMKDARGKELILDYQDPRTYLTSLFYDNFTKVVEA